MAFRELNVEKSRFFATLSSVYAPPPSSSVRMIK